MTITDSPPEAQAGRKRENHSAFARRLGVSPRTIDRWTAQGILPQPDYVRGRKYWDPDIRPRHDDASAWRPNGH